MTPIMVALFDDFGTAQRARTELVADGFPTDRVELTSRLESGQADAEPGTSFRKRIDNYFHVLFDQTGDHACAEQFAEQVENGSSAITVHPRADYEIDSARLILKRNDPQRFEERIKGPVSAM